MAQPVWITPAGDLGTIPEGIFYQTPLQAYDPDSQPVFFELLAGQLPSGIEIDSYQRFTRQVTLNVPRSVGVAAAPVETIEIS